MKNRFRTFMCITILIVILTPSKFNAFSFNVNESNDYNVMSNELKEILDASESNDIIPVYIWTKDINQKEIDEKVENELGVSIEDLDLISENIDVELAKQITNIYDSVSIEVATDFKEYFKETETKRIKEKEITDKYITTRRDFSKQEYINNNNNFITETKIENNKILFKSAYAPLIVAELSKEEIQELLDNDDVVSIEPYISEVLDLPMPWGDLSVIKESMRINDIYEQLGLSGLGVRIGMVDHGTVQFSDEIPSERFNIVGTESHADHADNSAKIVAGTNGIAYNATVFSIFDDGDLIGYMEAIEKLLDQQVTLITCSRNRGGYSESLSTYPLIAAWTDHVVSYHNVTFIAAVGNGPGWMAYNGHNIIAPANADNVISVSGFDNKETVTTADDTMEDFCYDNGNQALKPDIVAPSNFLGGGTSSATPFVSGVVALMFQLRPSLEAHPEVVKAILMASCHYKALPYDGITKENMFDGLTEKQGAGCFSPYYALAITAQGNYGVRTIPSGENIDTIKIEQPYYSDGLNVSIAWLKDANFDNSEHVTETFTPETRWDLDLYLKQENSILSHSLNETSSTEMVYVSPSKSNNKYTIEVKKYSGPSTSVRYGYAWSLNNEKIQYTQEFEGIYYLKNKRSGYYATLDSGAKQSGYSGSNNQKWIVVCENSIYKIKNASIISNGYIGYGSIISGGYYSVPLSATGSNIDIIWNSDGSVSFTNIVGGKKYALGILNRSTGTSALMSWSLYEDLEDSQKWYLEKIAYRKGDVNTDGIINAEDAQLVLQYAAQTVLLDSIQLFLADIDGNGVVDSNDALLILKY